jgi:pimeloyl-ACP methyl ester carboxylesterase
VDVRWTAAATASGDDRTAVVSGLSLHYLTWGAPDLPRVVLVHGGSAHAHWWDFVAPALADRYHLIALDLRGHGDSQHATPPAYAIDDYVRDLEGLVAALALERFALVGHSLGGVIALTYAGRHTARLTALALVDSRPTTGTGRSGLVSRLSLVPHPVYADREDAVRRFRLLPRGTVAAPDVLRHVALAGLRPLPDGGFTPKFDRRAFSGRTMLDLAPVLRALGCPTLLVRGSESAFLDAATLQRMGALCPHAELAEIADAHHHVTLDRPEAFTRRLAAFLDHHVPRHA